MCAYVKSGRHKAGVCAAEVCGKQCYGGGIFAGDEVVLCKQGVCFLKHPLSLEMHGGHLPQESGEMCARSGRVEEPSCLQIHAHFQVESGDVRFRVTMGT